MVRRAVEHGDQETAAVPALKVIEWVWRPSLTV